MARIDVVTIFPEFFDVLGVSLIGKARDSGTLDVTVHDLRQWAEGKHRSVDDTPAGGGAGMVMRADVWGKALDDVVEDGQTTLIIPTPGGETFSQELAEELAADLPSRNLVIACGRYEGIDSRVAEHYRHRVSVKEVSIGDYVLNGGETAAMVMIEAIGRLLPGVMGNPESLTEESHGEQGLLEYPVFTGPSQWRGLTIPPVLRSGDHGRIAQWRQAAAVQRTAQVRPDLLANKAVTIRRAKPKDAPRLTEIAASTFYLACPPDFPRDEADLFVAENLSETQFRTWAKARNVQLWVAEIAGVVIGYATVMLKFPAEDLPNQETEHAAHLSKMYCLPEHHGSGAASLLLTHTMEQARTAGMRTMWLGVNQHNKRAQRFYSRHGFEVGGTRQFVVGEQTHDDFVMVTTLDFSSVH